MSISSKIKIIERKKIEDSRGWFLKVINGLEDNLPPYTGEVYLTNATSGEAKGGHYHPLANEWFTLITGICEVKLVDLSTGEKLTLQLSSKEPKTLYVPNNIAHIFINNSDDEFILLAYSDQIYNPADTIMFSEF
jgi:dTDP-4-dehydrorhamnose 3,5-epimerase-like enzyme